MPEDPCRRNEEIVYIGAYPQEHVFDVHFAGVSYPDPQYIKRRDEPRDMLIIEYVIRGAGYICADGKTQYVEAGDMYVINAKFPHSYYSDRSDPFEKIWMNVTGSLPTLLLGQYLPERCLYIANGCERAYKLIRSAHELLLDTSMTSAKALEGVSLVTHELLILLRDSVDNPQRKLSPDRCEAIRECLDRSMTSDITLDEIAERYYLSKNQLIRSFRARYGMTPMKYLQKKRLEAAKRLAANGMTVARIAGILKFSSPQHLSSAYKREFGCNLSRRNEKNQELSTKSQN